MPIISSRYGKISVPSCRDLIFDSLREYGEWAQIELDILDSFLRPGNIAIDVGAFIGTHARAFSTTVGSTGVVHAFEQSNEFYPELLKNTKLSPLSNIKPYNTALGKQKSIMYQEKYAIIANYGSSRLTNYKAHKDDLEIPVQSLDDLLFTHVDFIKIDVEGMEYDVLLGADRIINESTPVISIEVNSLNETSNIFDWAKNRSYVMFPYICNAFNEYNFNSSLINLYGDAKECSLLLIHQDTLPYWGTTISKLQLNAINTIDELSIVLLHKPQYLADLIGDKKALINLINPNILSEFETLKNQLQTTELAKEYAETLAIDRIKEISLLTRQLIDTQAALQRAEELALDRLREIQARQS